MQDTNHERPAPVPTLLTRSVLGGVLMGLANLVPGISGGTMLLASGIYPRFINAIAELTRLKFRFHSVLVLGAVVASALVAIVLLAGLVKGLVVDHRWVMYALFIGLTLGGVPVVWGLIKKHTPGVWIGAFVGFVVMAALAVVQAQGAGESGSSSSSFAMLGLAGVAGASAMILPGVSGGYLLLVLGQYIPILAAIDEAKEAVKAGDFAGAMDPALHVFLPVGLGVVLGVVVVSNLLKVLLDRFPNPTLGFLLGLLLGAVVGLYPFQRSVPPTPGDVIKGEVVTAESIETIDAEDWPLEYFRPSGVQIAGALGLIAVGFVVTMGVARFGREKKARVASA